MKGLPLGGVVRRGPGGQKKVPLGVVCAGSPRNILENSAVFPGPVRWSPEPRRWLRKLWNDPHSIKRMVGFEMKGVRSFLNLMAGEGGVAREVPRVGIIVAQR